jgi:polyisoprenoid-binding protein YceI
METQTLQRAGVVAGAGTLWSIDPDHSTIGFPVKHMLIATVHGRFGGFRGAIRFSDVRPENALVEVQIDAASIDTGIKKRDEHLRSADFFDVAAYPTITFRSRRVEPASPLRRDRWLVAGDLTMHGVTRSVELAVEQTGGGPDLWDVEVASFAATTKISRKDFGIGLDLPLESGEFAISDDVKIVIDVQVVEGLIGGR